MELVKILWRLASLALIIQAAAFAAFQSPASVLTTVKTIRALSADEAARHVPVKIRVVVTDYRPKQWRFAAEDKTGGIYFDPEDLQAKGLDPNLQPGQIVTMEGFTDPGEYSPTVRISRISNITNSPLPKPLDVSIEQMEDDRFENRLVRLRGKVVSAALTSRYGGGLGADRWYLKKVTLVVQQKDRTIKATLDNSPGIKPQNLIGAEISAVGVSIVSYNRRRQMLSESLEINNPQNLTVLRAAARPAFDSQAVEIASLFAPGRVTDRRRFVKVKGTVTLQTLGTGFFVQQGKYALEARTTQWTPLHPGDVVEVSGRPNIDNREIVLEDAYFRLTGEHTIALPASLDPKDWKNNMPEMLLGAIDGVLVDRQDSARKIDLLVQANQLRFHAILSVAQPSDLPPIELGTSLRLTGVCLFSFNPETVAPESMDMLLRAPADVRVLRLPPWWNLRHSVEVLGAFLSLIVLSTAWGLSLRRRVFEKTRQLEHLALHDSLTGLPNRRLLATRMASALECCGKSSSSLALVCLDLDRFKQINDTLGHSAGDEFLKKIASRLSARIRPGETLARTGGDEFVFLLPLPGGRFALEARLKDLVAAIKEPVNAANTVIHPSASIGVSVFPDHSTDSETLTRFADQAMYKAKKEGESRYRVYEPDMAFEHQISLRIEQALRTGIQAGYFDLHFQPQCHIGGDLIGFEALLRFSTPELGPVSPAEFIPVAESAGLISAIGEWVLREVCHRQAAWRDQGLQIVPVAINVSVAQFRHGDLPEQVRNALANHSLDPSLLEIEITESLLIGNTEHVTAQLRELREMGVRIAIDDFGTGHSSLSKLHLLPIDRLKIDRSFVQDLGSVRDSTTLVRSVIALASSLGLAVLAEGVETEDQLRILSLMNCRDYQGYLFSRPVPVADASMLIPRRIASYSELQFA